MQVGGECGWPCRGWGREELQTCRLNRREHGHLLERPGAAGMIPAIQPPPSSRPRAAAYTLGARQGPVAVPTATRALPGRLSPGGAPRLRFMCQPEPGEHTFLGVLAGPGPSSPPAPRRRARQQAHTHTPLQGSLVQGTYCSFNPFTRLGKVCSVQGKGEWQSQEAAVEMD